MTINQITQDNLKTKICPLPPYKEQIRIITKIDQVFTICDKLEMHIDFRYAKHGKLLETLLRE